MVTRQLGQTGKILGIERIDHVIFGRKCPLRETDYTSLREAEPMQP